MKPLTLTHLESADLFRQLALLMHAGVAAGDALSLLAREEESGGRNAAYHAMLKQMTDSMDAGAPLSQAFAQTGCFPAHVTGLLQVGEQVGRVEETLHALADDDQQHERTARQLKNALAYPAILLALMAVVILVLLSRVLPVFGEVYASLGAQLTGVAGALLALGQALSRALPALCVLLAALALVVIAFACVPALRERARGFFLRHWGDRGLFRRMNNARFAQALSMGFASGMPLEDAVDLAALLLRDIPAAAARCRACGDQLRNGKSLADALAGADLLPGSACRLLALGLRSGTGDRAMEEIARRMREDAEDALERAVSRVEPALVLLASVLVGAILLSVLLPLMNIMTAIG